MKFFIFDGECSGSVVYYNTEAIFNEALDNYPFHDNYCGDGLWEDGVELVVGGELPNNTVHNSEAEDFYEFLNRHKTHQPERCNTVERPDESELDEGYDENGINWEDADYETHCDYRFVKIEISK